jgi:hypothetical protein
MLSRRSACRGQRIAGQAAEEGTRAADRAVLGKKVTTMLARALAGGAAAAPAQVGDRVRGVAGR